MPTPNTWPVEYFLANSRSAEALGKLRKSKEPSDPLWDALFDGELALKHKGDRLAELCKDAGQLLFCFEGTTVLQGGAA